MKMATTALINAIDNRATEESVKVLLEGGTDVNSQAGKFAVTALMLVVESITSARGVYTENMLNMLLAYGADANISARFGSTALMYAAYGSRKFRTENTVKILLDNGADVTLREYRGMTALHFSVSYVMERECMATRTITMLIEAIY
jgi:ankyrin repeat protein